jgi:hypothetical protein
LKTGTGRVQRLQIKDQKKDKIGGERVSGLHKTGARIVTNLKKTEVVKVQSLQKSEAEIVNAYTVEKIRRKNKMFMVTGTGSQKACRK